MSYLANEGFSISDAAVTLLVDALFGDGISGYPSVPREIRRKLEEGTEEWQKVDASFATHFHGDHFDPAAVARFLLSNDAAMFVSTPQSIAALGNHVGASSNLMSRAHAVLPEPGTTEVLEIAGVKIEVLNLHHGHRTPPVENLGLILEIDGMRVSHFGDTEAELEDFEPYLPRLRNVDVALLPFWFLTSEWRRDMVIDRIDPRAIVVAHLPEPTAPASYFGRWGSYDALIALIQRDFPAAIVPSLSGESWTFPR